MNSIALERALDRFRSRADAGDVWLLVRALQHWYEARKRWDAGRMPEIDPSLPGVAEEAENDWCRLTDRQRERIMGAAWPDERPRQEGHAHAA
ncbi:MAG: hypothetical protein FJW32_20770 [Acidobacteria bacterium]|nr:hypothetical protein [Acidobacteriota bacterium]